MLDGTGVQRARSSAVQTADYVSDRMVEGRPFDTVLVDVAVNTWLAALPQSWPEARDVLPPQFSDPAVGFGDGELHVGVHYTGGRWQAIVNVGIVLSISEDGRAVQIAMRGAQFGSLPVPRAVLRRVLDALLQGLHSHGALTTETSARSTGYRDPSKETSRALDARPTLGVAERGSGGGAAPQPKDQPARNSERGKLSKEALISGLLEEVKSVDQIFQGIKIDNRFVWFNGDRPFRIEAIEIDDGQMRLRIEPL